MVIQFRDKLLGEFLLERPFMTTVEEWLRKEVVPVAFATQADPGRAISLEDVSKAVRELHFHRKQVLKADRKR